MNIIEVISSIFKPVSDLVDNVHTSEEEKQTILASIKKLEYEMMMRLIDYEQRLFESQASVINTESSGQSWLQRSWRPITMLTFLTLVVLDSFGLLAFRLSDEAWTLLKIGLGGYVIGRSFEKIVPSAMKSYSDSKQG